MSTRRERAKTPNVQLNKQLAEKEAAVQRLLVSKEKKKTINKWAGDFFTDMAKLVFAGAILSGIFENVGNPFIFYGTGFAVLAVFLYLGYSFIKNI